MSKKSAKPSGPITRRQQIAAIRQVKGREIAVAVSNNIRKAVKQEVDLQLKAIKDTMFDMIDRVVECEARQNAVLMRRVKDEPNEIVNGLTVEERQRLVVEDVYSGDREKSLRYSLPAPCQQCPDMVPRTGGTCPGCGEKCERDSGDRQERTEAFPVLKIAQVVPDEGLEGGEHSSEDGAEDPTSR